MINIFFSLPNFLQIFILEIVGTYKRLIRRSGIYSERFNAYLNYYKGGEPIKINAPGCLNNAKSIDEYPIINKTFVKNNIDIYLKNSFFSLRANTSGSSGNGLSFKKTILSEQDTFAAYDAFRFYHGIKLSDWCSYFCGNKITDVNKNIIYRKIYSTKQCIFSQYHLNDNTIQQYINVINKQQSPWIHGYPSFLIELIRLARSKNLSINYKPVLVTTGSENLDEYSRNQINSYFNCSVKDLYCQSEMVAMIFECYHGTYHVNEAYSNCEFVKSGNHYSIIGTNLNNSVFNLLRYDTEDLVDEWQVDCQCGIKGRTVSNICGRSEDYILNEKGVRVGRLDHLFKGNDSIYLAQIVQFVKTSLVEFNIVVDDSKYSEIKLKSSIDSYLPGLKYKINIVKDIKREKNGKIKFVKRI